MITETVTYLRGVNAEAPRIESEQDGYMQNARSRCASPCVRHADDEIDRLTAQRPESSKPIFRWYAK